MRTIVPPKINLGKLWETEKTRDGKTFRLMKYVIRVDYEEKVLLHNVVTGQLVEISQTEIGLLKSLPTGYSSEMASLVDSRFLVTMGFDEHQKVAGLRILLRKLEDAKQKPGIRTYTILPTTACNAKCYYCFEKGIKPITMDEQTADDVIKFIVKNSIAGKEIQLTWFGGEPTVAVERINQICSGLKKTSVQYRSRMISNGYLFDADMVRTAKNIWNLYEIQISVDGTETIYNRIKNYVNAKDNPYQRVIGNIGFFLDNGISVDLRMNYDRENYRDFAYLVDDVYRRYFNNPLLGVRAHQINDHECELRGELQIEDEKWFDEKNVELNAISREKGLFRRPNNLPSLDFRWCDGSRSDSVTILPNGKLVSCPEKLESDQIKGDLKNGVTNLELVRSWKQFADYKRCANCEFYPACVKYALCKGKDICVNKLERIRRCKEAVIQSVNHEAGASKE